MKKGEQAPRLGLQLSQSESDIDESVSGLQYYREQAAQARLQKVDENKEEVDLDDNIEAQMEKSYKQYVSRKKGKQKGLFVPHQVQKQSEISKLSQTQTVSQGVKNPNQPVSQTLELNLKQYEYMVKMQSTQQTSKELQASQTQSIANQKKPQKPYGGIIDYSLVAGQKIHQIEDVPVYFPYKPYDLQLAYMESVIKAISTGQNALLESPTGTGKTLCLLASVLSYVEANNMKSQDKMTVIYCSRTHTQLKQVQGELEKTCFRPTMAVFGSRDQFCLKPQFEQIKGRDLMESCSKAVKVYLRSLKKKSLRIEQQSDQNYTPPNVKNPDDANRQQQVGKKQKKFSCSLYRSQPEYTQIMEKFFLKKIITSETLKSLGATLNFCPYYYSFAIKQKADIIFMPYNYILDVERLPRYESIIKNSIIIFDEAHNVPDAACEGRSYDLHSRIFENADAELAKMQYHDSMSPELKIVSYQNEALRHMLVKDYKNLSMHLTDLAQKVYDRKFKNQLRNSFDQNYDVSDLFTIDELRIMIYKWFCPVRFDEAKFEKMAKQQRQEIKTKTIRTLAATVKKTNQLIQELKQTYDGIFQQMQKLNGFYAACEKIISDSDELNTNDKPWWEIESNHFRLLVKTNIKNTELYYEIKLVCLTPSLAFQDLLRYEPRSIILTSGTLSPLESWQKQLNMDFKVQLMNKHVIDKSQLHLGVVCNSLGNQSQFQFSYESLKQNLQIYQSLVKTIVYFASQVPHGLLVIFPSYKIINAFKNELNSDYTHTNKLRAAKHICFEEKGSAEHTIQSFKNKAKSKKGAVLFCVCRGKVSEGLDFSDQLCRAVVFVGVPYPNVFDPILKEKKNYYNKLSQAIKSKNTKALSGNQWYILSTMRAVNQGIGRVIRHINDYGMILMLDSRYGQKKLASLLPGWSKESIETYNNFNEVKHKIKDFYKEMLEKFPSAVLELPEIDFSDDVEEKPTKRYYPKKQVKNQTKREQQSERPKMNPFELMMKRSKKQSKAKSSKSKDRQFDFI